MRKIVSVTLAIALIVGGIWLANFCQGWTFPDEIEVVYSRCRDVRFIEISADGRHMLASTGLPQTGVFLINLVNEEWIRLPEFTPVTRYYFVTNDLLFIWANNRGIYSPHIYDIPSQSLFPLTTVDFESEWRIPFGEAAEVFLVERAKTIIALHSNFRNSQTTGFTFIQNFSGGPLLQVDDLRSTLLENGVSFHAVQPVSSLCNSNTGCWSHNGKYIAKDGGNIYTANGDLIASKYSFDALLSIGFVGWAYDDSGLYFNHGRFYLIESGIGIWPPLFRIPRAALKLNVP